MRSLNLLNFVTDNKANKSAKLKKYHWFSQFVYSLFHRCFSYPIVYLDGTVSDRCKDFYGNLYSADKIPVGLLIKGYVVLAKEPEKMSASEVDDFCNKASIFGLCAQLPPLNLLKYMKANAKKINELLITIGGHELRGDWYRSCNSVSPCPIGTLDDNRDYADGLLLGIHFNQRNDRAFYEFAPDEKICFRPVFFL